MKSVTFSKAFEKFNPENVVFVISFDSKNDRVSGMIASWCTFCSFDPPLIAVALWEKGYTHRLIEDTKEFVVAVPSESLREAIEIFGEKHGDEIDKFKLAKVVIEDAKFVKPPLLAEATINFECKLEKKIKTGDHFLFIGKIVASYINEDKKVLLSFGKRNSKWVFKEF